MSWPETGILEEKIELLESVISSYSAVGCVQGLIPRNKEYKSISRVYDPVPDTQYGGSTYQPPTDQDILQIDGAGVVLSAKILKGKTGTNAGGVAWLYFDEGTDEERMIQIMTGPTSSASSETGFYCDFDTIRPTMIYDPSRDSLFQIGANQLLVSNVRIGFKHNFRLRYAREKNYSGCSVEYVLI